MKYLLFGLIALFGALLCFYPTRADLAGQLQTLHAAALHRLYDKELRYEGLRLIAQGEIARSLPLERSLLWWHVRSREISRDLEQHALVAEAAVDACDANWWSCFTIKVRERKPRALVELKDGLWVVDERGAFVEPVSRKLMEQEPDRIGLPLVKGVDVPLESPELARARTRYVTHAVDVVEAESGQRVEVVKMRQNGELELSLKGLRLTALFDADDEQLNRVSDEARRLRALIAQFKGRERMLEKVDLAYNTLAVVSLYAQ